MPTLYLHIGMPKTGTTYIQKFLRKNKPLLISKGYVFPTFEEKFEGIGVNRNAHFMVCKDKNGKINAEYQKQVFDKCFNRICDLFKRHENIILTEESLWNSAEKFYFNKNLWADLKKKSTDNNFDIKIIVYLRRQDLFVQSYWAQQVKETYTRSFEKFLEGKMYKSLKLDYYARLSEIAEHIGKENILVRVYEKTQYQGTEQTLISDFLHTIGLVLNDEYELLERDRVNRSLSGVYLETKRKMNLFDEFKVKQSYFSAYLHRVVENNQDEAKFDVNMCFSDAQHLKDYMASFAESNSKVAREFLGRADGVLFYEMPNENEIQESVKYKEKDILKILGEIISIQHGDNEELKAELSQLKLDYAQLEADKNEEIKQLQSTLDWVTTPFIKKIIRKIKNNLKKH